MHHPPASNFGEKPHRNEGIISSFLCTISDKIVDTFPFPTPYFVTVIPFCPPSLSIQPPSHPDNVVPQVLWCWGTNKQHLSDLMSGFFFPNFLREKKTAVIWCTKITLSKMSSSSFFSGCLITGCLNGGSCVNDEKKQKYLCLCEKAWVGEKCETKIGKKWFYLALLNNINCLFLLSKILKTNRWDTAHVICSCR